MKILLVYTGSEQGSWGSIAFPKPQHYYIMPGILYCAAALHSSPLLDTQTEVACAFFNTTVQSEEEELEAIVAGQPDVIGFSCYCWNIDIHKRLMASIRTRLPNVLIVCGGAEVCFSSEPEIRDFFSTTPECDALLFGEAEMRIAQLITMLTTSGNPVPAGLSGFACNPVRFADRRDLSVAAPVPLDEIPSPYPFAMEVPLSPAAGKAMVYETVRGCPFRCIYCQFSHRSHAVRKFPIDRLHAELDWLLGSGIECLHIADSVFDMEPQRSCDLLAFFRDRNRSTSLFCYCAFVNLTEPLSLLLSETRAQIGIGVQSTNPETLKRIERSIVPSRLIGKTELLRTNELNFYIDLMFGLPGDTPRTFERSFNETVRLAPTFMMLFPLSLIRGTPLAENAEGYGVRPVSTGSLDLLCEIRYDNIALAEGFDASDLERFDAVALACFYFYNRFFLSLGYLIRRSPDPADTLAAIGKKTKEFLRSIGRTATNTDWLEGFQDTIHGLFLEQARALGAGPVECRGFEELFKLDIYRILTVNAPQREKLFKRLNSVRRFPYRPVEETPGTGCTVYLASTGKLIRCAFRWSDLRNLETVKESMTPFQEAVYMHASFEDWDARITPLSPLEQTILSLVSAERPIRYDHLKGPALRRAKKLFTEETADTEVVKATASLSRAGILYLDNGDEGNR